jgi:hypothetical protein
MKILIIAFLFFCFTNPVSVLKSTKQEWKGGQGKSEGVNYKIQVIVKKSSANINFKSVTINNKECKFNLFKNNNLLKKDYVFVGNDTLTISTGITYKVEENKIKVSSDEVKINYTYKNKQKILEVNKFEKLTTLMYP